MISHRKILNCGEASNNYNLSGNSRKGQGSVQTLAEEANAEEEEEEEEKRSANKIRLLLI
jgi:hypothetical protein